MAVMMGALWEHSSSSASQDEGSSALLPPFIQMGGSLQWGRHCKELQLYSTVSSYIKLIMYRLYFY